MIKQISIGEISNLDSSNVSLLRIVFLSTLEQLCQSLIPYIAIFQSKPLMEIQLIPHKQFEMSASFDTVVLGGTFDYLHIGHQLLLLQALILAKTRVIIGVTDSTMLTKKQYKSVIQPLSTRILKLKQYVLQVRPDLIFEIVGISDPFGPSITEPSIDLIVVSSQTLKGGEKINEIRKQKNMKQCQIKICPMLTPQQPISNKISSTDIRKYILQKNEMSQQQFDEYHEYWNNLTHQIQKHCHSEIKEEVKDYWWNLILTQYSEYWRFYHTNSHIFTMLKQYKSSQLALEEQDRIVLQISIWFHDVSYVIGCADNEENSAKTAQKFILQAIPIQYSKDIAEKVSAAILITKSHSQASSQVEKLLIDFDMAILDSSPQQYGKYGKQIKKEYEPVVGKFFNVKRIEFLEHLDLAKVFYYRKWKYLERNIQQEIGNLRSEMQQSEQQISSK